MSDPGFYALFSQSGERLSEWTAPDAEGFLTFDITDAEVNDYTIVFSETGSDADTVFPLESDEYETL